MGELTQIVQAARHGDRRRTRERSPPQPDALRPHSTVVGKRKRGLEKEGEKQLMSHNLCELNCRCEKKDSGNGFNLSEEGVRMWPW